MTWNFAPTMRVTFLGSSSSGGKTWMGAADEDAERPEKAAVATTVVSPSSEPFTVKRSSPPEESLGVTRTWAVAG